MIKIIFYFILFVLLISAINSEKITSCPNSITSAFKVDETIYIFENQNVWKHDGNKIISGPFNLKDLFCPAPAAVNSSCSSSNNIIYLFNYKKVYAYKKGTNNTFSIIDDYPIELQPMIIPYPIKCFPLNNGSLIIGSGSASWTYDPDRNMPHMSGNFNEQFLNLPSKFISGYPEDNEYNNYMFLDKLNASKYSLKDAKIISEEIKIKNYLNCKIN